MLFRSSRIVMRWGWSSTKYSAVKSPLRVQINLPSTGRSLGVTTRKDQEEYRGRGSRMICGRCCVVAGQRSRKVGRISGLYLSVWSRFLLCGSHPCLIFKSPGPPNHHQIGPQSTRSKVVSRLNQMNHRLSGDSMGNLRKQRK